MVIKLFINFNIILILILNHLQQQQFVTKMKPNFNKMKTLKMSKMIHKNVNSQIRIQYNKLVINSKNKLNCNSSSN